MAQDQRVISWMRWTLLMGIGVGCLGSIPGEINGDRGIPFQGGVAHAAQPGQITSWHFNPEHQQLELLLPNGANPRYFLLAQPARIVLDVAAQAGASTGEQTFGGAVRRVRVAQFEPGLTRIVLELNPDAVLAPGQVELTAVETMASGETRWTLRPLLADIGSEGSATQGRAAAPAPATVAVAPAPPVSPSPSATPLIESTVMPATEPGVGPVEMPEMDAMPPMDMGGASDQSSMITVPPPDFPSISPAPTPVPGSLEDESIRTEAPWLADEAPLVAEQGADLLVTEPVSVPTTLPMDRSAIAPIPPTGDETLTAATFPEAVEIPIDFPSPTLMPGNSAAPPPEPTTFASPSIAISVPPPEAPAPAPTPVAVAPTDPTLLLPSGATLQLRYPRTAPLVLTDRPWQEVLVVANPVQDAQGATLIPAGTQVIGRFEQEGNGYRFVAQAIALDTAIIQLQGASQVLTPDGAIAPNTRIDLEVTEDLRRSPVQ